MLLKMLTLVLSRTYACALEIVEKIGEKLAYSMDRTLENIFFNKTKKKHKPFLLSESHLNGGSSL